jgi:cereblon
VFEPHEEGSTAGAAIEDGEPIRCRFCGSEIAHEGAVFGVDDRAAVSTFFNPQGQLMEVLTVRVAPGLRPVGIPTREFSWFPGTAWQVGACSGCGLQIGWTWRRLDGTEPARFAGLLTDRILRT